jgi:hypothetical protein
VGQATGALTVATHALEGRVKAVEDRHCDEDKKEEVKVTRRWDVNKSVILLLISQIFLFVGMAAEIIFKK